MASNQSNHGSFVPAMAQIAREAGALLMEYFRQQVKVKVEYKGEADLVTVADRNSEMLIRERIKKQWPSHDVLGEEQGLIDTGSEYRWYVDPLDGTTNFAHGFPVFNVTLALERAGELVTGVIFDPIRNELFTTEKGAGAYLNGERIHVSSAHCVLESLLATGFPSRKRHENLNVHFYYQLAMLSHGVRRAGSAALDLAFVACGRLDAFWEFGLSPWDMAAGVLLVNEAGGATSDMMGGPVNLNGPHVLTDNGAIHQEILGLFDDIFRGHHRYAMPEIK